MSTSIHATAIIDSNVHIGENVNIGPYTVIEDDVVIGDECTVGSHVVIGSGTRIGNECRIFPGACIGLIPQDLKFKDEKTYLRIGDRTTIREFCTLNRGTVARGETVIGSDCLLMAYCHVAHDCVLGNHVIISNNLAMAGHVEVGDYVTIGGIVPIHQFTRIGSYAFIAAQARPFMDVVPYAMCGGEGKTKIVGINKIGLERRGFSGEQRRSINWAFRILFRESTTLGEAIDTLTQTFPGNKDIELLVSFIAKSERGIMRM
jgi:UDP-N-acetylglucosamine acyltransferase